MLQSWCNCCVCLLISLSSWCARARARPSNATPRLSLRARRFGGRGENSVKCLQARGGQSRCFCFTRTNFVSSLMRFVLLISTNKHWRAKSNDWWGWGMGGSGGASCQKEDGEEKTSGEKKQALNYVVFTAPLPFIRCPPLCCSRNGCSQQLHCCK